MAQAAPDETDGSPPKPTPLWRNRDYTYWWTGNGLNTLGTSVSTLAFPLLILYLTGSAAQAGLITVLAMLGKLAALAVGGVVADRISRRGILIWASLVQAVAMGTVALLVLGGDPSIPLIGAMALISGVGNGMRVAVQMSVLRRIVPKEQIADATAQTMGRDMVAQLVGAPLGGLLYSIGRWIPFVFDAITYFFMTITALVIRRPLGPERRPDDEPQPSFAQDLGDGVRMIRRSRYLTFTLIWGALLNTVAEGFILLFVVLIQFRGGGPTSVGLATSLAVVGGVVGAVLGPWLMKKIGARQVLICAAWFFVASFAVVVTVPQPWQIGLVMMVGMSCMVPLNVVTESYEVRLVPDAYLGRVAATSRFCVQGVMWVGPLVAGLLADRLGVQEAILILASVMAGLALMLHLGRSRLNVLDTPVSEIEELSPPPSRFPKSPDKAAAEPPVTDVPDANAVLTGAAVPADGATVAPEPGESHPAPSTAPSTARESRS